MRIGEYGSGRSRIPAPGPPPGGFRSTGIRRYRELPEADLEAGQEKLRSAVEWGIYHRFTENGGPISLLNLKPACGNAFFSGMNGGPVISKLPEGSDAGPALPGLPAEAFDAIYGLDIFQRYPDPATGMAALARALKPRGTLFLNFFSAAHFRMAADLPDVWGRGPIRERAALPLASHSPPEIQAMARACGLSIAGIIPYSAFYGNSLWIELMQSRFRWERILDWFATDAKLFDFALHLEETFTAGMGVACAPRFAAVLRKAEVPAGVGKAAPAFAPPKAEAGWLPEHFGPVRNRVFFYHLWKLGLAHLDGSAWPGWRESVPQGIRGIYAAWASQEALDGKCMSAVRGWHAIGEVDAEIRHRGVPLGPGLEYEQLRRILSNVFGCFGKADA